MDVLGSWPIDMNITRKINTYLELHEVTLEDTLLFSLTEPETISFYKVWEKTSIYTSEFFNFLEEGEHSKEPIHFYFTLSNEIFQHQRKIMNVLEISGFLGGIFEIFEIIFGFCIGTISSFSFKKTIISEIKQSKLQYLQIKHQLEQLKLKQSVEANSHNQVADESKNDREISHEEVKFEEFKYTPRFPKNNRVVHKRKYLKSDQII